MSMTKKKPSVDFKNLVSIKEGEIENYQVPYQVFEYRNSVLVMIKVDPNWGYPDNDTTGNFLNGYGTSPSIYMDINTDKERFLLFLLHNRVLDENCFELDKELERIGDAIYYKYIVPYMSKAVDDIGVKSGAIPKEWIDEYKEKEIVEEIEREEPASVEGYNITLVKWEALKIANLLKGLGRDAEKIFLEELNKKLKGEE